MATPLPVITNGFRVAHQYHSSDATFVNVFWLLASVSSFAADVGADFIDAYQDAGSSSPIKNLHSSDVTFDQVTVTPLDGVTPSVDVIYPSATHGGGASPPAAANAALVVTWETDQRGRAHRGRSYLGGCPAASLETGGARWGTALITDANLWIPNFLAALEAASNSYTLMVVSQRAAAGPSHRLVGSFVPRQGVGTQRGRTERAKP